MPESIIKVNGIKVEGNRVELSLGLYKKYLLDNLRIESKRKLDETFTEFAPLQTAQKLTPSGPMKTKSKP